MVIRVCLWHAHVCRCSCVCLFLFMVVTTYASMYACVYSKAHMFVYVSCYGVPFLGLPLCHCHCHCLCHCYCYRIICCNLFFLWRLWILVFVHVHVLHALLGWLITHLIFHLRCHLFARATGQIVTPVLEKALVAASDSRFTALWHTGLLCTSKSATVFPILKDPNSSVGEAACGSWHRLPSIRLPRQPSSLVNSTPCFAFSALPSWRWIHMLT